MEALNALARYFLVDVLCFELCRANIFSQFHSRSRANLHNTFQCTGTTHERAKIAATQATSTPTIRQTTPPTHPIFPLVRGLCCPAWWWLVQYPHSDHCRREQDTETRRHNDDDIFGICSDEAPKSTSSAVVVRRHLLGKRHDQRPKTHINTIHKHILQPTPQQQPSPA